MASNFHHFYQVSPKALWVPAPASERKSILFQHHPFLTSVLDVNHDFKTDLTSEQIAALKFKGPFYADFDSESIETAIVQFKKFLNKLQNLGLNLEQCSHACTGGRGFHCLIPQACFMAEVPEDGTASLPYIYKELAHCAEIYTNDLDPRVYTGKRGRLWRTFGVLRDNGQYKISITAKEAMAMTPALYAQLCAAPRELIQPEPPTLASALAALYIKARDKVFSAQSKRKLTSIASTDFKQRAGGNVPPTLVDFMGGRLGTRASIGWNQTALQLGIAAHALGLEEDQLIDRCRGLIDQHQGDSKRYGTTQLRERQLRDQFAYLQDNPCYAVSIPGLLSILPEGCPANDLRDMIADVPEKGFPTSDLMIGQGRARRLRTDVDALLQLLTRDPRLENLVYYDEHLVCLSATRSWREAMQMPHAPSDIDELNDDHALALQHWFASEWKLDVGRDKAFSILRSWCLATSRNPVQERMLDLAKKWDGEARLDTWLIDHCNASCNDGDDGDGNDVTPLMRAFGTKFLISVIARIFNPGCQVDSMVILLGGQGARKSSVLRALGDAIDPRCYADSFDIADHSKDRLQKLRGKCLIEWAEMSGLTKRDVREVKTFLTERNDEYRAPYERCVHKWPRTAVFAGSTNNDELLADETGGRRFWIVRVQRVISRIQVEALKAALPQILGEAVSRYKMGERWWIDPEDEAQLHALAEAAQESVAVFSRFDSLALSLAQGVLQTSDKLKYIADQAFVPLSDTATFPYEVIEKMLIALNDDQQFSSFDWKMMSQSLTRQGWEKKRPGRAKILSYKIGEQLRRRLREAEKENA